MECHLDRSSRFQDRAVPSTPPSQDNQAEEGFVDWNVHTSLTGAHSQMNSRTKGLETGTYKNAVSHIARSGPSQDQTPWDPALD